MKRPRRNHSAKFKAKVALAAMSDDKTIGDLAQLFDVHANQIADWNNHLLKQSEALGFASSGVSVSASRTADRSPREHDDRRLLRGGAGGGGEPLRRTRDRQHGS